MCAGEGMRGSVSGGNGVSVSGEGMRGEGVSGELRG